MCLVRCLVVRNYHGSASVFISFMISTEDYVPTVPQSLYFVEGPVTDELYFLIVSSNQAASSVSTHVPILDGTNYREWAAQMRAYLRSVDLWLIVSSTTTAPTDPVELQKWTLLDLMANSAIELRCSLNIQDLIGNTSAATWTALSTTFGVTGVSHLFGDFKAVTQFRFSGMQHPAAEISHFNTHNQRLVVSGVTLNGYILGMLLLGALPSKWDHVAAIYFQGKTAHIAIDYTEV